MARKKDNRFWILAAIAGLFLFFRSTAGKVQKALTATEPGTGVIPRQGTVKGSPGNAVYSNTVLAEMYFSAIADLAAVGPFWPMLLPSGAEPFFRLAKVTHDYAGVQKEFARKYYKGTVPRNLTEEIITVLRPIDLSEYVSTLWESRGQVLLP